MAGIFCFDLVLLTGQPAGDPMAQVALTAEEPVQLTAADLKDIREMLLRRVEAGCNPSVIDVQRAEAIRQLCLLKRETARPTKGKAS